MGPLIVYHYLAPTVLVNPMLKLLLLTALRPGRRLFPGYERALAEPSSHMAEYRLYLRSRTLQRGWCDDHIEGLCRTESHCGLDKSRIRVGLLLPCTFLDLLQ